MKRIFLKPILLSFCLASLWFASFYFVSPDFVIPAEPAQAETLSIGVSHSEYLPSVPDIQARVSMPRHYQRQAPAAETTTSGTATTDTSKPLESETMVLTPAKAPHEAEVQSQALPAPSSTTTSVNAPPTLDRPIVEWFPIPSPMAGIWTKRGDLTTSVTDLRTGLSEALNQWTEDEMTVTWGHQTDKLGNVWHANLMPSERDGLSAGKAVKFLTVGQKLEASNPHSLVTRTHYVVSESYGRGGPVADIFQQEALNHYQLVAEGELQNNSTNRVFAYQGQAVRDGSLLTRFNRVGAFAPTASLSGIDLVQSLNDYLRSIGRTDLMR